MKYDVGDILRTKMTGTHVMVLGSFKARDGTEYIRLTPLHQLGAISLFDLKWTEEQLVLVQRGKG